MKYFAVAIGLGLMTLQMTAQTPQANTQPAASGPAAPAWSPSKSIGVFAFPKNNQNADEQLKDESDCYGMAKQQSGVDPQAAPPAGKTAEQKQAEQKAAAESAPQAKGGRARGAARGAAGGAAQSLIGPKKKGEPQGKGLHRVPLSLKAARND